MAENTTVTNDAGANGANGSPPPAGAGWADSFDPDTKGWVSGKAWDKLEPGAALAEAVKLGRAAEQKLGVPADQILRLPGKDAKPEDWRAVWQRLGAPEKPEGYEIQAPDGGDAEFLKTAVGWFHELNLPKPMASALAGKWNEYAAQAQARAEGAWNERFDKEVAELKGEWKADYDKNLDLSNRVLRAAGFTPEQQMAIEQALGPKAFRQSFAKFGSMVGEHKFHGGDGQRGFQMSPEAAKTRLEDLKKDQAFQAKYLGGDAEAKAEWTRLHQIAFPEPIAA